MKAKLLKLVGGRYTQKNENIPSLWKDADPGIAEVDARNRQAGIEVISLFLQIKILHLAV
jgi:hypothetical protein